MKELDVISWVDGSEFFLMIFLQGHASGRRLRIRFEALDILVRNL
jgi:hypothetical protein